MKNKKLIIIIILLIILGSIYPIYYIIKKNQKIENKIYYYELKNNSLTLLANGKIINFYNCDNECSVYENYFDNGKILLQENNKIYLYDLVKGSKLSSDYENVYFIKDENEKVNYLLVKNGQYYGIINMSGSVTVNLNYKELGKIDGVNVTNLNVKEDYITALSDNNYGLISLSNGKGVIDFQYENITIKNNKIIAKENSKWYLIGKDNRKTIKTGYDELIPLTQNNIVRENNSIYLIDEQGNIISEKLVLNKNEIIEKYEDETLQIINEETAKRTKYIYDKESNKFTKTK